MLKGFPDIADQAEAVRAHWPAFQMRRLDERTARWNGPLRPLMATYEVEIAYRVPLVVERIDPLRQQPRVRVLSPRLRQRPGDPEGRLPHVYWDDRASPSLCLFDFETSEWSPFDLIALTTLPWSLDWLACYEGWRATGKWTGGGRHAEPLPRGSPDVTYVPPRRSEGTIQTRRIRQPWPAGRPFRILSIDGGGICGILPASVLAEIEMRFLGGGSVARFFDLVGGTSTGGIIALALAHGRTAAEIRDVYVERGATIFPPPTRVGRLARLIRQQHRYVYERGPLESEMLRIFGDTPLGEARTRLCIPAFEGRHGEPWIFKTPHHPDYRKDRVERMVRVGLLTAAAPTYFEALPNNGYVMVDGGLWANNPVMNALVDALACYDLDRAQVEILSLGCGETAFRVDDSLARGGMVQWRGVIRAAMRAQSLNALGQAYLLVGKDKVMRVDAPETPTPIDLDDHRRASAELPTMARSLVEASGREIARVFLREEAEPYVPCPLVAA